MQAQLCLNVAYGATKMTVSLSCVLLRCSYVLSISCMVGLRSLEVQINFYHSFFCAIHITPQEYLGHEMQSAHILSWVVFKGIYLHFRLVSTHILCWYRFTLISTTFSDGSGAICLWNSTLAVHWLCSGYTEWPVEQNFQLAFRTETLVLCLMNSMLLEDQIRW